MGNDNACNVLLLTSTSCKMLRKDVRHVSDIMLNLISVGWLDDEGYSGSFQNGMWKFCKGNLIVAHAGSKIHYM